MCPSARRFAEAAAKTFEKFGKVHILCNNAGVSRAGRVEEISPADWEWVIGVNLHGTLHGIRAFRAAHEGARRTEPYRHDVLDVGLTPKALAGPYGATKFALVGLSHVLRDELADTNIGVSVLCPGWTNTNMPDNGRNRPARFGGAYDFRSRSAAGGTQQGVCRRLKERPRSARSCRAGDARDRGKRALYHHAAGPPRQRREASYDEILGAPSTRSHDRLPKILNAANRQAKNSKS